MEMQDARRADIALLRSEELRVKLGDISHQTLWRWQKSPTMKFPQPFYIKRARYWRLKDINEWLDKQSAGP